MEIGIDGKSPTAPGSPGKDNEHQYTRRDSVPLRFHKQSLDDEVHMAIQRVGKHVGTI